MAKNNENELQKVIELCYGRVNKKQFSDDFQCSEVSVGKWLKLKDLGNAMRMRLSGFALRKAMELDRRAKELEELAERLAGS